MTPPPDWMIHEWNLIQAARAAGVSPWDLAAQPAYWLNKILFYLGIEEEVREMKLEEARKERGRKGR